MQGMQEKGAGQSAEAVSAATDEYQRTLHRALAAGARHGTASGSYRILVARTQELREALTEAVA
jgi:hypothetical protein